MKKLDKKGFTLVELAIVMVIIGLLIGAVIKGQAMIDNAKQKRLLNDVQGISAAYFSYYDRYNAVPGDDTSTHGWAGVAAGDGDGLLEGNATTPSGESQEAWQALRYAGLLTADPTTTGAASLPAHPFSGKYGLFNRNFGASIGTKNYILVDNVNGNVAEIIDIKNDDGIFNSGTVQADQAYTNDSVDLYYAL
ncbi:MAG: prepilin-type N-terminal cleavage/methylation domain-containing protein [Nitrospiraceae bacterium]|nr:MAG: prepilin-type N-terminal cleavage/methylation domain-containing protein [Nitrospiraceae bacterium]